MLFYNIIWLLILLFLIILFVYLGKIKKIKKFGNLLPYFLIFLSGILFLKLLVDTMLSDIFLSQLDFFVSEKIIIFWNLPINNRLYLLVASINILIALSIITAIIYFLRIKKYDRALLLFIGFLFSISLSSLIKALTKIPRPSDSLVDVINYGFPSNHAAVSATVFSLIIYCFYDIIKNQKKKIAFILINIFIIFLVSFSRIYLKVHKFSEVVAGLLVGLFVANLLIVIYEKYYLLKSK